jgi:ABC-type amino acid transport system permease subunit
VTEIFRGAFLSIPRGQIEASRAIGITSGQTMRRIIIPQLLGVVIPSLTNEFVKLLKGSSVVSILAVIELTRAAQQVIQTTFAAFEIYGAIAVLYFVMCASVQYLSHCVELRVTRYR